MFMVWYFRFITRIMLTGIGDEIDHIMVHGTPPPKWDARLVRRIKHAHSDKSRAKVLSKHALFIEHRVDDLLAFMRSTSVVQSEDERADIMRSLEDWRDLYLKELQEL